MESIVEKRWGEYKAKEQARELGNGKVKIDIKEGGS